MIKERKEYWRREICESVAKSAKHGCIDHIDNAINSLVQEIKKIEKLEKENAELREQLANCQETKNRLDNLAANEGRENADLKKNWQELLSWVSANVQGSGGWAVCAKMEDMINKKVSEQLHKPEK